MMKKVFIGIAGFLAICILTFVIYVNIYSKATDNARSYLGDSKIVDVSKTKTGYFFDGPGTEDALVFYPGGKVEHVAYAPLMHMLAEKGVDCFLVKMPFRLAVFGVNKADKILLAYDYENWYIGGHSLGGAMASAYAYENSHKIKGVVLLGAYSTKDIGNRGLEVLSIYGSNDKVLNMSKYEKNIFNLPKDFTEICIEGGNHALFGDYGKQKGDGTATITDNEQWIATVKAIMEFVGK